MKTYALLLLLTTALAGCASTTRAPSATATLAGDAAHPAAAAGWVRTELYFGTGRADDARSQIGDAEWRAFLDAEVSTRFPDGLSVFDIYGQWRGKGQTAPERLRSKMILLLYPDTPQHRADVESIRRAWKIRTGDQSVLRVTQPAEVSF